MKCKYDRDADAYLVDGEPCRVDEDGQPTKHCGARLTCSNHVGRDELTCSRCIARARANLNRIVTLSALLWPIAEAEGVDSPALNLAMPAADPRHVRDLRFYVQGHATYAYRAEKISEQTFDRIMTALPDEDDRHPYSVLTRWQMMLSEDYGHPLPARLTVTDAAAYLGRNLHVVAQDPEQDFALLARELRKVCRTTEAAEHMLRLPQRGAPCPDCTDPETGVGPRLVREYGHWCDEEDCEQIHYSDDSGDVWRCPRDRDHNWGHAEYENYLTERQERTA